MIKKKPREVLPQMPEPFSSKLSGLKEIYTAGLGNADNPFANKELLKQVQDYFDEIKKKKNRCLLCDEDLGDGAFEEHKPKICGDCKKVFAAFKSILVAEKSE